MKKLILQKDYYNKMINHVIDCSPKEACGLLSGKDNKILSVWPIRNISKNPHRFHMDPKEQIKTFLKIKLKRQRIIGVYHSHTARSGVPSRLDIEEAIYSGIVYLIWYFYDKWRCRAFLITDGEYEEISLCFI